MMEELHPNGRSDGRSGPEVVTTEHPRDRLFRSDRLPHIWCPGCGLGAILAAFLEAAEGSGIPLDRHVLVSGIGCTARSAGYAYLDSFHTTHGRAIPFATGLKAVRPDLEVTVFSGDGDLFAIGGNHFLHAARRNVDLNIVCVNNFNYGMTGGQFGPTTPHAAVSTTTPYGNSEEPFNLPRLAEALGAVYVARWTVLHARQLRQSFERALTKRGLTFIEVLSPCPVGFGKSNSMGEGVDELEFYRSQSVLDPRVDLAEAGVSMDENRPLYVGVFVDRERPAFLAPEIAGDDPAADAGPATGARTAAGEEVGR